MDFLLSCDILLVNLFTFNFVLFPIYIICLPSCLQSLLLLLLLLLYVEMKMGSCSEIS